MKWLFWADQTEGYPTFEGAGFFLYFHEQTKFKIQMSVHPPKKFIICQVWLKNVLFWLKKGFVFQSKEVLTVSFN